MTRPLLAPLLGGLLALAGCGVDGPPSPPPSPPPAAPAPATGITISGSVGIGISGSRQR